MKKFIVLGTGKVGSAIAKDLTTDKKNLVTAVDYNEESLKNLEPFHINTITEDLTSGKNISKIIQDSDIVINALPGDMGFESLKTIIEAGKNTVDVSFAPENPFELSQLAMKKNITAIVDCGVAPGLSNFILGYQTSIVEEVDSFTCYVGGLPFVREWPFEYKAVFSAADVIEEYVRPARFIRDNEMVVKEALTDTELLNFEHIGTLEAFNSDGIRTLITTMGVPNMIEKTLRYPGTVQYLKMLRDCDFFSKDEVDVNGKSIRPLDVSAKLLKKKWQLKPGEKDFTVMKITMDCQHDSKNFRYVYELFDQYDEETQTLSMARTTGYTCSACVNILAKGKFTRKGICPPEFIGEIEDNFLFLKNYLQKRGIEIKITKTELNN